MNYTTKGHSGRRGPACRFGQASSICATLDTSTAGANFDIVRRVNPAITQQLKLAAMAVGFLLLGRWIFLHPDKALLYTKAREVSPNLVVRTLIRGVALVFLLGGSWVLCSSVFDHAAPALLHAHPSAFPLFTKIAAVLLAVVSVSIGKGDKKEADRATAASQ